MVSLLLAASLAVPAPARSPRPPRPSIGADARVELAAALHLRAFPEGGTPGWTDDGGAYARALAAAAAGAGGHGAADAYRRLLRRPGNETAGWMAALRELTLCLDAELAALTEGECGRSSLAGPAADFARKTGFLARWREKALPLLSKEVAALRRERDRADLVSLFESYSGAPAPGAHAVAPSPLLAKGLFWNGLTRRAGTAEIVTVLSPAAGEGAPRRFDWVPVMRDVWHENAHALMDEWLDSPEGRRVLSRPKLEGEALRACYGAWDQCVREHLAQGTAAAILDWARRGDKLPFYAAAHLKESLPLQAAVAGRLREYEADRARYPDLRAFYPRLLAVLEGAKEVPPAAAGGRARAACAGYQAGLDAFAAGRAEAAVAAFERCVKDDELDAASWLSLAAALGRGPRARAAADRAAELGRRDASLPPDFLADALSTRADLRAAEGDAAGAREDREAALESAPAGWPRRAALEAALAPRSSGR